MYQPSPNIALGPHQKIFPVPQRQPGVAGASASTKPAPSDFEKLVTGSAAPAAPAAAPVTAQSAPTPTPAPAAKEAAAPKESSFFGFIKGLIDIVNPLQHIPVVSTFYRRITGDEISDAARFAGDALYGGALGGVLSAADIAFSKSTGKTVGDTVIAKFTGDGSRNEPTQIAGPAAPSLTSQPVAHKKDVASTNTLQTHEAPESAARKTAPPELIASRMMEGLQKYARMKQGGLSPVSSGLY